MEIYAVVNQLVGGMKKPGFYKVKLSLPLGIFG